MAQPFKHVAIFGKPSAEGIREPLEAIARIVEQKGLTPMFDAATRDLVGLTEYPGYPVDVLGKKADVAVVLGGDGTLLGIARDLSRHGIPLIGINHGRLGFMTDIALDQVPEVLSAMLDGRYETDRRALLEAQILRAGKAVFQARAVNDVVVSRGSTGGMVEFTVRVDG
ncbi:MAG TPA: NAD(+)/NADH kinase, partial [Burkholderiaceae bacterium]|nr:NAD(+)/NADH kinase [Burkholderiaceae bacterium]